MLLYLLALLALAGASAQKNVCKMRFNFDEPEWSITDRTARELALAENYFIEGFGGPTGGFMTDVNYIVPVDAADPPANYVAAGHVFDPADGLVFAAPPLGPADNETFFGPPNPAYPFQNPAALPARMFWNQFVPGCRAGYDFNQFFSENYFFIFLDAYFNFGAPTFLDVDASIQVAFDAGLRPTEEAGNTYLEYIKIRNLNDAPEAGTQSATRRIDYVWHEKFGEPGFEIAFGLPLTKCFADGDGTRLSSIYPDPAGRGDEQTVYLRRDAASGIRVRIGDAYQITEFAYSLEVSEERCAEIRGTWAPLKEVERCNNNNQCRSGNSPIVDQCIDGSCEQTQLTDCSRDPACRESDAFNQKNSLDWCLRELDFDELFFGGREGLVPNEQLRELGIAMRTLRLTGEELEPGVIVTNAEALEDGFRLIDTARLSAENVNGPLASPGTGSNNQGVSQGLVLGGAEVEGGEVVLTGDVYRITIDFDRPTILLDLEYLNPQTSLLAGFGVPPLENCQTNNDPIPGNFSASTREAIFTSCTAQVGATFFELSGEEEIFPGVGYNELAIDQIGKAATTGITLFFNGNQEALTGMRYITDDRACVGGERVKLETVLVEQLFAESRILEGSTQEPEALMQELASALRVEESAPAPAPSADEEPPAEEEPAADEETNWTDMPRKADWNGVSTGLTIAFLAAAAAAAVGVVVCSGAYV